MPVHSHAEGLEELVERAEKLPPIRMAVIAADQTLVVQSVAQARKAGLIVPLLIGAPDEIVACAGEIDADITGVEIITAKEAEEAARVGVDLVRGGRADALMKGRIHTDALMRAVLDSDRGLRLPGQRVSHVFVVDIPTYPKLLAITDAAINISPDLNAKAQILQNAISLFHLLGVARPKVAVLSAVETVNPAIVSTVDAACLALMARRGQISGAVIDGPMAFDNAISSDAAKVKGIVSEVAGDVDILLVPDLISGNILAKNLEYLAGATAAGIVLGLSAPVVLSSRADPTQARLAAMALAVLMHQSSAAQRQQGREEELESAIHCAAQPESACCPIGA